MPNPHLNPNPYPYPCSYPHPFMGNAAHLPAASAVFLPTGFVPISDSYNSPLDLPTRNSSPVDRSLTAAVEGVERYFESVQPAIQPTQPPTQSIQEIQEIQATQRLTQRQIQGQKYKDLPCLDFKKSAVEAYKTLMNLNLYDGLSDYASMEDKIEALLKCFANVLAALKRDNHINKGDDIYEFINKLQSHFTEAVRKILNQPFVINQPNIKFLQRVVSIFKTTAYAIITKLVTDTEAELNELNTFATCHDRIYHTLKIEIFKNGFDGNHLERFKECLDLTIDDKIPSIYYQKTNACFKKAALYLCISLEEKCCTYLSHDKIPSFLEEFSFELHLEKMVDYAMQSLIFSISLISLRDLENLQDIDQSYLQYILTTMHNYLGDQIKEQQALNIELQELLKQFDKANEDVELSFTVPPPDDLLEVLDDSAI